MVMPVCDIFLCYINCSLRAFCCKFQIVMICIFNNYGTLFCISVDIVSTLEFEKRGDYLAVGDQGGRVVIFERKDGKQVRISHMFTSYMPTSY